MPKRTASKIKMPSNITAIKILDRKISRKNNEKRRLLEEINKDANKLIESHRKNINKKTKSINDRYEEEKQRLLDFFSNQNNMLDNELESEISNIDKIFRNEKNKKKARDEIIEIYSLKKRRNYIMAEVEILTIQKERDICLMPYETEFLNIKNKINEETIKKIEDIEIRYSEEINNIVKEKEKITNEII
jgi:hypothetical protein